MTTTFVFLSLLIADSCKEKAFLPESEKKVLFATPSDQETNQILSNWRKRDLAPKDYQVIQETLLNDQLKLKIVTYNVSGFKEYGALLVPKTDHTIPLRMYISGFGLGITTNSVELGIDGLLSNSPFILAIPALRGQSLAIKINGILYSSPISEGVHCDAFDGATDDALAFLNIIAQTEKDADVERTSIRGGSRGCTVALLAGIRDKRIKRVVGVAGPTDLITLTSSSEHDATYQCQFLKEVKENPAILAASRQKLIASSPLYFAGHLPLTQLHMGSNDKNVPIHQGYTLRESITKLGIDSSFQLFTYNRTHFNIATDNAELATRIEQFLSAL